MTLTEVSAVAAYGDAALALRVRGLFDTFAGTALHPKGLFCFITMADVPIPRPEDAGEWKFQIFLSFDGEQPARDVSQGEKLRLMKAKGSLLTGVLGEAIAGIPEGTEVYVHSHFYWETKPWDNLGGRATLAGDAAHPMTPYRGQGLNHAIGDAVNLVKAISDSIQATASEKETDISRDTEEEQTAIARNISAYDAEVVKRGAEEVVASYQQAIAVHDWETMIGSPMFKSSLNKLEESKA